MENPRTLKVVHLVKDNDKENTLVKIISEVFEGRITIFLETSNIFLKNVISTNNYFNTDIENCYKDFDRIIKDLTDLFDLKINLNTSFETKSWAKFFKDNNQD